MGFNSSISWGATKSQWRSTFCCPRLIECGVFFNVDSGTILDKNTYKLEKHPSLIHEISPSWAKCAVKLSWYKLFTINTYHDTSAVVKTVLDKHEMVHTCKPLCLAEPQSGCETIVLRLSMYACVSICVSIYRDDIKHRSIYINIQTFWRHDVFLMSWWTFWRHDVFLTSWRTFWHHDVFFDVMTYYFMMHFLTSWHIFDVTMNFVTSRRTLWCHDKLFDVMTNFLMSWSILLLCL